ncbi:MAG: hypothetical protein ACLTSG_14495 [Lachnospiraceae bacterium]
MDNRKDSSRILVETSDGTLISVPADKLNDWTEAQDEEPRPLTKAEQRLRDRIVRKIYGSSR